MMPPRKRPVLRLIPVAALIVVAGLFFAGSFIERNFGKRFESADTIDHLSATVVKGGNGYSSCRISGLIFADAWYYDSFTTSFSGDTMIVKIYVVSVLLDPGTRGKSGSFNVEIQIPDTVKKICYGDPSHVIWQQ